MMFDSWHLLGFSRLLPESYGITPLLQLMYACLLSRFNTAADFPMNFLITMPMIFLHKAKILLCFS